MDQYVMYFNGSWRKQDVNASEAEYPDVKLEFHKSKSIWIKLVIERIKVFVFRILISDPLNFLHLTLKCGLNAAHLHRSKGYCCIFIHMSVKVQIRYK